MSIDDGLDEGGASAGEVAKRVLRTGIALLHEGELVLPAAGSEAEAEVAASDARAVIQYHFPVVVEVRGGGESVDTHEIAELVLRRLANRLEHA